MNIQSRSALNLTTIRMFATVAAQLISHIFTHYKNDIASLNRNIPFKLAQMLLDSSFLDKLSLKHIAAD